MIPEEWTPKPIYRKSEREPLPLVEDRTHPRYRLLVVAYILGGVVSRALLLKLSGRFNAKRLGELVRAAFQKLGVVWIKLGADHGRTGGHVSGRVLR